MKIKETRAMSVEELNSRLSEMRSELIKLNAQVSTGTTPKSPGQIRTLKKSIAKVLTILNEKNQGGAQKA